MTRLLILRILSAGMVNYRRSSETSSCNSRHLPSQMINLSKKRKHRGVGGLAPPPIEVEQKRDADRRRRVVFVLEGATLETARLGGQICLLNADDHKSYLAKHGKEISNYRPDILHHALLTILDSPLCKMGHVQDVYVHTVSNVLVRVDPTTKLPRTYHRFAGLMAQLLEKYGIRAEKGPGKLLKCVKGPITNHLPSNAQVIALSREAKEKNKARAVMEELEDGRPCVFVVGAFAHGHFNIDYAETAVSISPLPLSAACCLAKLTNALEDKWDIA